MPNAATANQKQNDVFALLILWLQQVLGVAPVVTPSKIPVVPPSLMAKLCGAVFPIISSAQKKYSEMSLEDKFACMTTIVQVIEIYNSIIDAYIINGLSLKRMQLAWTLEKALSDNCISSTPIPGWSEVSKNI